MVFNVVFRAIALAKLSVKRSVIWLYPLIKSVWTACFKGKRALVFVSPLTENAVKSVFG